MTGSSVWRAHRERHRRRAENPRRIIGSCRHGHNRPHRVAGDPTGDLGMDRTNAAQLRRLRNGNDPQGVISLTLRVPRPVTQSIRTHREREMRPLPVHIAVLPTAQLGRRHLDDRIGTALRWHPAFPARQPMADCIDRGLEDGTAFGIELPLEDEHAPIGLVAVQPALRVIVIGIGEHAVGIDASAAWLRSPCACERDRAPPLRATGCLRTPAPAPRRPLRRGGRPWRHS